MTESNELGMIRRLDRLYASRQEDSLLSLMATLSRSGVPIALGLLVDGVLVRGSVTTKGKFASALDESVQDVIELFFSEWDEESRNKIGHAFTSAVEVTDNIEDQARQVAEKYFSQEGEVKPLDIDSMEIKDVVDVYSAGSNIQTFEISEAKIFVGNEWIEIGVMRVEYSHVGAWWPLRQETNVEIHYHPSADADQLTG